MKWEWVRCRILNNPHGHLVSNGVPKHKGKLWALCDIAGHDDWVVSCSCGWKPKWEWAGKKYCKRAFHVHIQKTKEKK